MVGRKAKNSNGFCKHIRSNANNEEDLLKSAKVHPPIVNTGLFLFDEFPPRLHKAYKCSSV
jgi:hypothetical protein